MNIIFLLNLWSNKMKCVTKKAESLLNPAFLLPLKCFIDDKT